MYIADHDNHCIRKVTISTGIIATIAGTGSTSYTGDNGQATAAAFYDQGGIALDSSGNMYVADVVNQRIRKVTASTGIITTIAGSGGAGYSGDGGAATSAKFRSPSDVTLDTSGKAVMFH